VDNPGTQLGAALQPGYDGLNEGVLTITIERRGSALDHDHFIGG
jgi:hypothetical protein